MPSRKKSRLSARCSRAKKLKAYRDYQDPKERKMRLAKQRSRQSACRAAESQEQKEDRLARKRADMKTYRQIQRSAKCKAQRKAILALELKSQTSAPVERKK